MPRRISIVAVLVVAMLRTREALAQTTTSDDHAPNGTLIGMTIGVPGYGRQTEPDLLVVGLNVLHAQPSRLGIDFALGTIPKLLSADALVLGGRLDAVLPIAVTRDLWLMPAAGGSMIGAAAGGGGTAIGGVNAGLGAIAWSGHFGLRTSMTWHHFTDARGAIWLAEVGFVGGR